MALLYWCCILLAILLNNLFVQASGGLSTTTALQCLHVESKKCTIPRVDASDSELVFPNLEGKTTLQIKGGHMPAFGEQLCSRLGTVKTLKLGSLQLKELCLTGDLREVSAARNEIDLVKFGPSSAKYELEYLDLQSNRLKTLDGFEVLVNLVEVHLEHNELESFNWGVFERMTKLEKLFLNSNKFKNVVADKEIELPVLDYLSLAENQLTNLDVSNWKFESLTEYDFSSNELSKVDNLKERFPSSQAVHLANNRWYCSWLQDTLEEFNQSYVVIKDRDDSCEGIPSANICCTPENDIIPEDTTLDTKLRELEEEQENLRSSLKNTFETIKTQSENELETLEDQLRNLTPLVSLPLDTETPSKTTQNNSYEQEFQQLSSTVDKELKQVAFQRNENERALQRLSYTMLELKRFIERGRKTTAGLQNQLDNLRTDIYRKQKERN